MIGMLHCLGAVMCTGLIKWFITISSFMYMHSKKYRAVRKILVRKIKNLLETA